MSLAPGSRLGPYEITALIGAGGMGEVYKARDTRLNRDVAIKILPASFAADRERLRRFQMEAQAVAALSHPNILAVYDLGEADGAPYLVSELLEGETLSALLARGAPSHRKATAYAIQTAQGLAAAHSRNIAHRDLKPDNIYITREGQVKILDFGLAKSTGAAAASPDDLTRTESRPVTDAGTVMGTVGYMSPEQVRGAPIDTRTDIFSFGAVFFEMLTGVRAFKRDTSAETMTAILKDEPPETLESARQIPPALDRIVRHCLEKSPDQRFQSARDLAFDLESASNLTSSGGLPAARGRARYGGWRYAAVAVALALIAAFSLWRFVFAAKPITGSQFHQLTYRLGQLTEARFSADGQTVLYTASWAGTQPEIYTVPTKASGGRSLDIADARLLAVAKTGEVAVALRSHQVTPFIDPGTLARVTSGGGAPKPEIENVVAADYTPDGTGLAIVRYRPDKAVCQLEYPVGKVLYTSPLITDLRLSPRGKYLAFIPHDNPFDDRGRAVILRTDGTQVAASADYDSTEGLAWVPDGSEIWFTSPLENGQIHALSLAGKNREVLSVPGRLYLRDIGPSGQILAEQGISHLGMMVSAGKGDVQHDLSWLNYGYVRAISDDGQMILFEEEGESNPSYTIYVRNSDGSPPVAVGEGYGAALSNDKNWVLSQKVNGQVWLLPVGAGEGRRISPPGFQSIWAGFLPNGKAAVFMGRKGDGPPRIWLQNFDGGAPRPLSPDHVVGSLVSPDGRWVLAGPDSDLTGRGTLLVPIDGGAPVPIAGLGPDDFALGWTSDGRLYVAPVLRGNERSVQVAILDPHSGKRTAWRELPLVSLKGVHVFGLLITPDGSSYAYGYGLRIWDLYTITPPR